MKKSMEKGYQMKRNIAKSLLLCSLLTSFTLLNAEEKKFGVIGIDLGGSNVFGDKKDVIKYNSYGLNANAITVYNSGFVLGASFNSKSMKELKDKSLVRWIGSPEFSFMIGFGNASKNTFAVMGGVGIALNLSFKKEKDIDSSLTTHIPIVIYNNYAMNSDVSLYQRVEYKFRINDNTSLIESYKSFGDRIEHGLRFDLGLRYSFVDLALFAKGNMFHNPKIYNIEYGARVGLAL